MENQDTKSHDQLYKDLFKAFFDELLALVAPELTKDLDVKHPEFLDKEQFLDLPQGKRRYLDLLAKVPVKRPKRGEPKEELVLIHTEIEEDYREEIGKRLSRYAMQLKLRYDLPLLSIGLFVNGGEPGITLKSYVDKFLSFEVSRFNYLAFALSPSNAEEYLSRPGALVGALAAKMKRGELSRAQLKLACIKKILGEKSSDEAKMFLLVNFVQTYLELKEEEAQEYTSLVKESPEKEVLEMQLTWADQMRLEGKIEEKRATVVKILALRKIKVSAPQKKIIEACEDPNLLDTWLEKSLSASSARDLFEDSSKTPKK